MAGNKKISELSTAGTLTGSELVEIVQSGGNVKVTTQLIANLGGGGGSGITGVAAVGSLLRVLTVGTGDVIETVESSHISESEFSMQATIVGAGSTIAWITQDADTNDTSSFQSLPEQAVIFQTNGVYYAEVAALSGELYMKSISVPLGGSGVIGLAADGKLFTTTAGISLSSTLDGLSIVGSSITNADTVIGAFGALQNQINGILGGTYPQGLWNATTNTPALSSGVGTSGYYYIVSVAGSTNLDGITDWKVGDWAIFLNGVWNKVDNTDAVVSVNGGIGAVVITTTGTADRITITGGSGLTPTIDIASTYAGQSSIVTVGTLSSGAVPASLVTAGTFGTGAYVMDNSLTVNSSTSGMVLRAFTSAGSSAIYNASVTPSGSNFAIRFSANTTFINGATGGFVGMAFNGTSVLTSNATTALTIADAVTLSFGTTTGTKLGTATTQKIAFWNKTPIIQPTTGITAAAFVSNTSLIANDTATFGGYTIGQIAAALINTGILA